MSSPSHQRIVSTYDDSIGTSVVVSYHRDFPDIRACGADPDDATSRLKHRLAVALESVVDPWAIDAFERALADFVGGTAAAPQLRGA